MSEEVTYKYELERGMLKPNESAKLWVELRNQGTAPTQARLGGRSYLPTCYVDSFAFLEVLFEAIPKARERGTNAYVLFENGTPHYIVGCKAPRGIHYIVVTPQGETVINFVPALGQAPTTVSEGNTSMRQRFSLNGGKLESCGVVPANYVEVDFADNTSRIGHSEGGDNNFIWIRTNELLDTLKSALQSAARRSRTYFVYGSTERSFTIVTDDEKAPEGVPYVEVTPGGQTNIKFKKPGPPPWTPRDVSLTRRQKFVLKKGALVPYNGENVFLELDYTDSTIRIDTTSSSYSNRNTWYRIHDFFTALNQARLDSAKDGKERYVFASDDHSANFGVAPVFTQVEMCPAANTPVIAVSGYGHTVLGQREGIASTPHPKLEAASAHSGNFYYRA